MNLLLFTVYDINFIYYIILLYKKNIKNKCKKINIKINVKI